jgi:histidinol-phosphate phosphatase family protein
MTIKEQKMNFKRESFSGKNSLFLDRDGVINEKIVDGYVLDIDNFRFIPGVLDAIPILNKYFKNIFIVTNQQCIGKGLLDFEGISRIHNYMLDQIRLNGGVITEIFVSPYLESERSDFRKPNTGMAYKAVAKFPEVDLTRSIMVGDSYSDMIFGRDAGMLNILVDKGDSIERALYKVKVSSLLEFAKKIETGQIFSL